MCYHGDKRGSIIESRRWKCWWRRRECISPSFKVEQVEQKEQYDGEEDWDGEYKSLINPNLKCMGVWMIVDAWSLRNTHFSLLFNFKSKVPYQQVIDPLQYKPSIVEGVPLYL